MSDNEVTLTIDGKSVTVPKGTKVVDAAKQVDILKSSLDSFEKI